MNFDQIQQLIRIAAYAIGGYFLGEGVMETDLAEGAVGGIVSVSAFAWWYVWERKRPKATDTQND